MWCIIYKMWRENVYILPSSYFLLGWDGGLILTSCTWMNGNFENKLCINNLWMKFDDEARLHATWLVLSACSLFRGNMLMMTTKSSTRKLLLKLILIRLSDQWHNSQMSLYGRVNRTLCPFGLILLVLLHIEDYNVRALLVTN